MNPTPRDIVESLAWASILESLMKSYFERFVATDPSQPDELRRLRMNLDALHEIDRELHALAQSKT